MRARILLALALLSGCNDSTSGGDASTGELPGAPVDPTSVADAGPGVDAAGGPAAAADLAPVDDLAPPPDLTPPPTLADVHVVVGAEQVSFDWTTDRCENLDLPDTSAHAIRVPSGVLVSASNAPTAYFSGGPDLDHLSRHCTPSMISDQNPSPEAYAHWQWPASLYRIGGTIYSLVHDEYHDPVATNCLPGDSSPANPCWWNSITLSTSTDYGASFSHAAAPSQLIAAPPRRWNANEGGRPPAPYGYMEPSNIVHAADGYYYSAIRALLSTAGTDADGTCMMRTQDLSRPASWRFWNGTDWTGIFVDPYSVADGTAITPCAFVSHDQIGQLHGSLTYSTFFQRYLLVGASVIYDAAAQRMVCGFYASASSDFVAWSSPKLLVELPLGWAPCDLSGPIHQYAYPSLIDPTDTTDNFERVGAAPYLYYMRNNGMLDRDLVRVPLQFQPM